MNDTIDNLPAEQEGQQQRQVNPIVEFRRDLDSMEDQFKAALPAHIPAERFARVLMTAVQNNPVLLTHCSKRSLWNAAMRAAQDGLLPDGREGAIVPFKGNAQWMIMVAGLRKKVRNSGEIATWEVNVVHENDQFDFQLGDEPYIHHRPTLTGEPGKVIAAYSIAVLKTGEKSREVMTRAQIDKVRAVSRAGRDDSPWNTWFEEMARKTVARRHSKVLPMSTDLDDLLRRDDALYGFEGAAEAAAEDAGEKKLGLAGKLEMLAAGDDTKPIDTTENKNGIPAFLERTEKPAAEAKPKPAKKAAPEKKEAEASAPVATAAPAASVQEDGDPGPAEEEQQAAPQQEKAAASAAPAATVMTPIQKASVKKLHESLMGAMSRKGAQTGFDRWVEDNKLDEGDLRHAAGERVLTAHLARISGDSSPAEADAILARVLA